MKRHAFSLAALVAVSGALVGCGGGGGSDGSQEPGAPAPGPLEAVPPSASASSGGLVAYLLALVAQAPDDREPVSLQGFEPPLPDDQEPQSL